VHDGVPSPNTLSGNTTGVMKKLVKVLVVWWLVTSSSHVNVQISALAQD
jgi:hypothetical protein